MWSIFSIFSLLALLVVGQKVPVPTPTVRISQGTVTGSVASDGEYFQFFGIPYADSTSGSHRFKAPSPAPLFQETFVADRKNVKCVRALGVGFEGTEDCLVANVFTPSLSDTSSLPVMVWIKGKEFDKIHEHELSFRNFIDKEVVIVTLNFRESILGFLCLGTETAPGNAGLKDIVAGLRWVRDNVAQFGGDPNNVSLFGHGSGAAAVDLVTISPMAAGLVHKAIAQSGTAMAPWAVSRDNTQYAVQVAEALGHTTTDIESLSEVFTRTSIAALMAVINELDLTDNSLAFAPCIERENLNDEPFLIKSPYNSITEGEFLQIPFMTGFVDKEGTIRAEEALEDEWLQRMDASFTDFIQPDLRFENVTEETRVADEIKSFYFGDGTVSMSNINSYLTYHGDTMILVSAIREARMRAVASKQSIYLYQFSYKGSLGEPFGGPLEVESAAHSEDLAYLFYDSPENNVPAKDLAVGDILIERWTNFAKTGIPSSETSEVMWQPFTTDNTHYLRVLDDDEVTEGTLEVGLQDPHTQTMAFWDQIYEKHFFDAEGRWDLIDRNEEEDDDIQVIGEESGDEDGGEDEVIDAEDTDENEDSPDSASTVIGYTSLIVILFTILNTFHSSQILS